MTVDAVIVAYRSEDVIEETVLGCRKLGGTVVVVDHGDGESARRAALHSVSTVVNPDNPGFGAGQNFGVARTTSPYVLLCNPDVEIVPQAVAAGAVLLDARPDVAAVQGVIVNQATGRPERSAGVELRPIHLLGRAVGARRLLTSSLARSLARRSRRLRDHVERVPDGPVDVESLAATVVLMRRTAFAAVGGFDQSFFLYGEDLDLCRRLRRAGWSLLAVPEVWATHASGGSAESGWSREVQWWRGTMQFAARWWGPGAWTLAVVAAVGRWARLGLRRPSCARLGFQALVSRPMAVRAIVARTGAARGAKPEQ